MGEWQPIETAPRGCRKLLLWCPAVTRAFDTGEFEPVGAVFGRTFDDGEVVSTVTDRAFTHWMPAPPNPLEHGEVE